MTGSMDDLIRANKRKSALLVAGMFFLFALLGGSIAVAWGGSPEAAIPGLAIAFIVGGVTFLGSYYGGAALVMTASGARQITKADHQVLWNVVEELCIASNLPIPAIYIIDDTAPNAFATGRDPDHAAVAITTGLLQKLDRDELQGVMAHELSHVQNFDIRLMMLMAVMVGSIALFADMFLRSSRYAAFSGGGRRGRSGSSKEGNPVQAIALVLAILLSILAPIAARMLMLAVSREREYLADASAAKMTHYPDGLARALAKISGDEEVLEAANRATQHLYIINPIKAHEARAAASSAFSTHPPVAERIKRLQALVGTV